MVSCTRSSSGSSSSAAAGVAATSSEHTAPDAAVPATAPAVAIDTTDVDAAAVETIPQPGLLIRVSSES